MKRALELYDTPNANAEAADSLEPLGTLEPSPAAQSQMEATLRRRSGPRHGHLGAAEPLTDLTGAVPSALNSSATAQSNEDIAPGTQGRSSLVARNVLTTLAAQLVSWGVTFVLTLYVPRYIGKVGFGMLTVAGSFSSIAAIVASFGTGTVIIREIARDNSAVPREVAAGLAIRAGFGLFAVLLGFGAAVLFGYSGRVLAIIAVSLAGMLLGQLADVLSCGLQGLERMPQQNAALLASRVIAAALQIYAVMHHMSLLIVVATGIVGTILSGAYALRCLKPFLRGITFPTRQSLGVMFRAGVPLLSVTVFLGIYAQSDSILLSKLCSFGEAAWYGLARQLIGSTLFIPVAVTSAMLPTLSRLHRENYTQFVETVARMMNLMLICVTPFAALLVFAPTQILAFLHYGRGFYGSIPVLMAMAGAGFMWYISQVAGTALLASDRQKELSRASSIGAAICIPTSAACILLARHFLHNGAVGAAVSNGLTECVIFFGYTRALPPGIIGWRSLGVSARSVVASLPLVAWLYCVHNHLWFALGALPLALLYVLLCWWMKCFQKSDLDLLRQVGRRKVAA